MGGRSRKSKAAKASYAFRSKDQRGQFRPEQADERLSRIRMKPVYIHLLVANQYRWDKLCEKEVANGLKFPRKDFPTLLRDGCVELQARPLSETARAYWRKRIDDVSAGKIKTRVQKVLGKRISFLI